jgi:intracellular multiplication protein IcmJ
VRHLDRRTIDEEAVLIWLPEMTQPALNKLANVAHRRLADAGALYRAADPLAGLHQDIARGAIEALRAIEKRRIEAEARLGTSSPRLLAAALLRAKPKFYQDRARLLGGLRLLCRARFFVDGEDIYPRPIAARGAPVTPAVVRGTVLSASLPRDEVS